MADEVFGGVRKSRDMLLAQARKSLFFKAEKPLVFTVISTFRTLPNREEAPACLMSVSASTT